MKSITKLLSIRSFMRIILVFYDKRLSLQKKRISKIFFMVVIKNMKQSQTGYIYNPQKDQ